MKKALIGALLANSAIALLLPIAAQSMPSLEELHNSGSSFASSYGCNCHIYYYNGNWYAIDEEPGSPWVKLSNVRKISDQVAWDGKSFYCKEYGLRQRIRNLGYTPSRIFCSRDGWQLQR